MGGASDCAAPSRLDPERVRARTRANASARIMMTCLPGPPGVPLVSASRVRRNYMLTSRRIPRRGVATMLSWEDNELLCRVGPGTPMGDLMRQYWVPAALSSELPARDGAPLRVRLLGEDLIAFRASSGGVGLIRNSCPHRGASLFYGRNEGEGLRCVYHGWKFDVTGRCVDMPNEPPESNFCSKVRAIAYPCVERHGVIWAYLGPRPTPPPLPDLEPNMLPRGEYAIQKVLRECNWFQALEGDIDTSHLGFLHLGAVKPEDTAPGTFDYYNVAERAPRYEVVDTEFGTSYGAYRTAEADTYYWRIAHF